MPRFTERDGVPLAWTAHGTGDPAIILLPTWSIVPSRFWKAQVPYLARHHSVITFDGRGCGASGRPVGAAHYADAEYVADTVAVLDAAGVDRAVVVGLSAGAAWAIQLAAEHPDRVIGVFAIAPSCLFDVPDRKRDGHVWDGPYPTEGGWATYNREYWLGGGYDDFLRFFFAQMFSEPHSTKQIEDGIGWGHEVEPSVLADTVAGRLGLFGAEPTPLEPSCARVRCPVTVLHGTDDQVRPVGQGERLAELTGGTFLRLEGGGHGIPARDPVLVNREIARFAAQFRVTRKPVAPDGTPPGRTLVRASRREKRALFLSSPIGLGHARRDVAIADALRKHHPDLRIDWLAQHPVTRFLAGAGERVHPASDWLASESAHIEDEAADHDLHVFQAIRRMDAILVQNFMVYDELTESEHYDLVIGDEAWEVDYFLHENPQLKRSAYAWLTDFVGWLPMPDGGPSEAGLTADYNAEMLEHRARFRRLRDRSIFVGNPADIVDGTFGPGLPSIREWTAAHYDFAGYVLGAPPAPVDPTAPGLARRTGERVCLVTVGGSGVGLPLLRRVADAVAPARRLAPDLRFVLVTGPRIDPAAIPARNGLDVIGYLPDLPRHLAGCDVAVVQGGLSTTMELTAAGKPFLYVPLQHHFEQNFHVPHRLARYNAGRRVDYAELADPERLASAIVAELDRPVDYRPVETDGASRVATLLADLL